MPVCCTGPRWPTKRPRVSRAAGGSTASARFSESGPRSTTSARPTGAAIVNTCSTGAIRPFPNHAAYGSSKWALRGLTQVAAAELAPSGIRVNAVFPGPIETPMLDRRDAGAAGGDAPCSAGSASRRRSPTRWPSWCPSTHRSSPVRNSSSTAANACRSDDRRWPRLCRWESSAPARAGWRWESSCGRPAFGDFTIFDREDGVGGTWRINTYPGLACDVKSHLYSYSFDLNANWSRLWSAQPEILEYFERCAQRYRLGPNLKLNTEIVSAQWDADSNTWRLTTSTGEQYTFDVVVSAVGLFTQPVLPDLVEEEPFTGTLMHTARWDHSVDLQRRAGGRPGHGIDCVAAGSRGRQGRQEGLLGAALADVDPAEARPAPTPIGRSGSSPMSRSPRRSTEPGCGCAASRTSG